MRQIQEHVKATPADEDRPYGIGGDRDDWREIPWPEAQAIEKVERLRRRHTLIRDIVMEADPAEREPLDAEPHLLAIERFLLLGEYDLSEDFRGNTLSLMLAVREFARTHRLADAEDGRVFSPGHMGKPPDDRLKAARQAFREASEALSAAWKSFRAEVTAESARFGPEVVDVNGGSDERNILRREMKAMLDWLFTLEYEINRAASKIDPKSHPNGHPPTFLKMPLADPPELRELSPRMFFEPLRELKKFVRATKSIVEADRIRQEAVRFPGRKSAILVALKKVDAENGIGLSFPEN